MIGLLLTVTAADGAARGESVAVVLIAGALVLLLAWPEVRRERRERDRRRQVQSEIDAARRRRLAREAMGRAARSAARSEDGSAPAASGGVGLPGLLFLTFLVLKLTGVIDWSWWWVTAPLWISAAMFVIVLVVVGLVAAVVSAVRR